MNKNLTLRRAIALLTVYSLIFSQLAQAVTLATAPLANITTSVVRPNIMFVLDDSGSMAWDYTPDYINDAESPSQSTWGMCWGTTGMKSGSCPMSGSGGLPSDSDKSFCCNSGKEASVPWYTADVNYQYYSPDVRYTPPVKADGTSYGDSVCFPAANAAPNNTCSAKADGFSGTTSTNLITTWPHQVWCNSSTAVPTVADPTAGGKCLQVSDTTASINLLPDATHVYPKNYNGAPVYFKMDPSEYCQHDNMKDADATHSDCVRASDSSADRSVYNKPSLFRWCASYTKAASGTVGRFNSCQKNRDTTHYIPNYLGSWNPSGSAPAFAWGDLTVDNAATNLQSINSITIGGVEILANDGAAANADGAINVLVGFGNTASNPAAPGTGSPAIDTSANVYAPITLGRSFAFSQGLASYTTAPYDPPNQPYKYEYYANATLSTPTDVAKALCQAIHANAGNSGYDCPTVPTTSTLRIQAANVGAAPNGKFVVASGPAGASAVSATATFAVSTVTNNFQATALTVDGTQNLLGSAVTADGNVNTTAQQICQAIYSGPYSGTYDAISGGSATYGNPTTACLAGSATVTIRVKATGSTMNGKTVAITGPAAGTHYTGTITVNSVAPVGNTATTYNATAIDNITIGGTSILSTTDKATLKWDGTQPTSTIATAIATAINSAASRTISGCASATASNNVVTITGSSTACNGSIAVVTNLGTNVTNASATFTVSASGQTASTAATLGTGSTFGSITGGSANISIAGQVSTTDITDGTAVSNNATTLKNKINALTGTTNLTAGNPSCSGSGSSTTCTFTVTTSDYRSAYNGTSSSSFSPQHGTSQSGTGSSPKWNFNITNATTASRAITSIKCGTTTHTITQSTATTGSTGLTAAERIQNLATNSTTNGLNGKSRNGYDWSCSAGTSPAYNCTLQGPLGVADCTNLSVSKDSSITTSSNRTNSGAVEHWTYDITGATSDSKKITSATCGGTHTISNGQASTGSTTSSSFAGNLATDIITQQQSYGGSNMWSQGTGTCSAVSASTVNCQLAMSSGSSNRCTSGSGGSTTHTLSITGLSSGLAIADPSSSPSGGTTTNHVKETWDGTRYWYSFDITGASAANLSIGNISCAGNTADVAATNASTGASASSGQVAERINNLTGSMNNANSFSTSCTTATTASPSSTCTVTVPSASAGCTPFVVTNDASITVGTPQQSLGARPVWDFSITNATSDPSKTIDSIQCNGTDTFNTSNKPNTGTPAYRYIWNLTQNASTGLNAIGANSYGYSCTAPTLSSPSSTCTVTGPSGARACDNLTITPVSSSGITFSSLTPAYDPSNPGAAGSAFTDFYAAISVSGNSNAYKAQSTAVSGITSIASGPIAITPSPATFAGGVSGTVLTIPTNATGSLLAMAGGADAATANSWQITGIFKRTDIVPTTTAYAKSANRTDCVTLSGACSYAEELQNFANWYTYYRTRMLMMKSASTLAFNQLDGKYRVGFDNISNCQGTCATTVVQPVAQFVDSGGEVTSQRSTWWTKLTAANPSSNTPLRSELAKIGQYYAHKLTGTNADPIQYSCQQNFTFMVTDGYWNEAESAQIKGIAASGTAPAIGNVDNVLGNGTGQASRPFYDGSNGATTCPATGSGSRSGFSSCRTLADVAWYYYSTDLRTSTLGNATNTTTAQDVSENNVPTNADDTNPAQHMVLYTMGLGVDGTLDYRADYKTAGVGDFADITSGLKNWPAAANLDPTGVDDLWHAAVNGHGKYFSARNPSAVLAGLTEALNKIGSRVGAAAAAATSNLSPVSGDNYAYVASYTTVDWTGDLQSRTIDLATGQVSPDTNCGVTGSGCIWSAQAMLDNQLWSTRNIYVAPSSNTPLDAPQLLQSLSSTEISNNFSPTGLSQYGTALASYPSSTNTVTATNLMNYLRGDRGLEMNGGTNSQVWRQRAHVLGDIVDTTPVYVKAPAMSYTDAGYSDFKASTRKPVVYISAQDGMLHAFNAYTDTVTVNSSVIPPGGEMWAYIPKEAMGAIKTLADANYTHRYFIDGQITVGDAYFGGVWHTILVAGLGGGGKSYIALDVTDPLHPLYLWEFTDTHLGYTNANASIGKLPSGDWAVFFTSGYNNDNGNGYLYAVKPEDGTLFSGYPLSTGSSNLGKIGSWVDSATENRTVEYLYAGDLNGKVWRFDMDPSAAGHTGQAVFELAQLKDAAGTPQPITTMPQGTTLIDGTRVVYVGTGQYLGIPDLSTTGTQSLYAIKDTLGVKNLSSSATQATWNPRTDTFSGTVGGANMFLPRKLISTFDNNTPITKTVAGATTDARQICSGAASQVSHTGTTVNGVTSYPCINESGPTMDWATYGGWYVDFPDTGERLDVDMNLTLGTLTFATNVPNSNACTSGGYAWLNYVDAQTGLAVPYTSDIVGVKSAGALIKGVVIIKLPDGSLVGIITTSDNRQLLVQVSFKPTTFSGRRNLWREFEVY